MAHRCGICSGDPGRRKFIDRQLAAGLAPLRIESVAKEAGYAVKRETVSKHRANCLGGADRPPEEVQMAARASATGNTEDFAALVKAEAVRRLNAGELKITTGDGLAAQSLIDRRQEKQKDRELAAQIGRLLAGGGASPEAPLPLPPIIEGDYIEVTEPLLIGSGD
jgi:hypothetical protein